MYLDQLAMAPGLLCFNENHAHKCCRTGWNQGYEQMLSRIRSNYDCNGVGLIYEGCSDIHGGGVSGQLISTMFDPRGSSFPELYKYTFPEQILVDMMNPRRHSGMRAEILARNSTYLLYRAFVMGSYLWVYDLAEDNTFTRDEEQYQRLKATIALRKSWLEKYGQGIFRDNKGLGESGDGVLSKRYISGSRVIIAAAKLLKCNNGWVDVEMEEKEILRASVITSLCHDIEKQADCYTHEYNGKKYTRLFIPDYCELAVFVIEYIGE